MVLDENNRYVHPSGKRVLVGDNKFNEKVSDINSAKNYSVYYKKSNNDSSVWYGDRRTDCRSVTGRKCDAGRSGKSKADYKSKK